MNEERDALLFAKLKSKIEQYCAYSERCSSEVRAKLEKFGCEEETIDKLLTHLVEENFLDDERFAKAYANGKLRQNKWGKIKIGLYLKQKEIPPQLISTALASMDDLEYHDILEKILYKKLNSLREPNPYVKNHKAAQYATGKGFEQELIWAILKKSAD